MRIGPSTGSLWLAAVVLAATALAGCAATRRAAGLVMDHHVGMARYAVDVVSGKAEEREQRMRNCARNSRRAAPPSRPRKIRSGCSCV